MELKENEQQIGWLHFMRSRVHVGGSEIRTMQDNLEKAVARLVAFRRSWNDEDRIDPKSGLTARDLDLVISAVNDTGFAELASAVERALDA